MCKETADYMVSVITPLHNVDMTLFKNCRQSMLLQTIGFENIQWIIVLHNCKPNYEPDIKALFREYDNVMILVLNNERHTASSPRNYGVKYATAPYIGYLDSDDSYTPDCLKEAVREIKDANANVLCFRREYEKQREDLSTLTETILWNQAEQRIIIEKGKWNVEKMFNGIFGMVTSKLFDREFLQKNEITFDESIPYAEDMAYTVSAFANADRICYLPQLIGYHYFINDDSLVQSRGKSGKTLIEFAKGMARIFDMYNNYGIESDSVLGLCMQEAFFILGADPITIEDRVEIADILRPYILQSMPLRPNKINDEDTCRMMYEIPREVILHPEDPFNGPIVTVLKDGGQALRNIVSHNANTDFGQMYSFSTLKTVNAYQFRVPLCDSASIRPMIALQTNVGETNILTASNIINYSILKNGDLLANTATHLGEYHKALNMTLAGKKSMLIGEWVQVIRITNDGKLCMPFNSMLLRTFLNEYIDYHPAAKIKLTSSSGTYFSYEGDLIIEKLWSDALMERDLEQIVALNTGYLVRAFKVLENNWEKIVEDLRSRDDSRADEVTSVFKKGFDEPVVNRLWPKLQKTVAYGSGEFRGTTAEMRHYTGNLPHNHGYLYSEAALLGHAVEDDSEQFVISDSLNFYELLPVTASNDVKAITLSQAEPGTPYQLVVTNTAGLYRYVTDHFIVTRSVDISGTRFTIY